MRLGFADAVDIVRHDPIFRIKGKGFLNSVLANVESGCCIYSCFCPRLCTVESEASMRNNLEPNVCAPSRSDEAEMFELAPVSLWLEDYSAIQALFDEWRAAGITDLRRFLNAEPMRVAQCSGGIRVIKVNRKTLEMLGARDFHHLVENLDQVFRGDMLTAHIDELVQLWAGETRFSSITANYTLSGQRLDVLVRGIVLPGHETNLDRVMVSLEDVTEREAALRSLGKSDAYARALFQHSPVSLWVEDFSAVKSLLDDVRQRGVTDFRAFTGTHPDFVRRCLREIRVVDVNRHTLALFEAPDVASLSARMGEVLRDDVIPHFREQLLDLWAGKLFQQREVVNYALSGQLLHLHQQFSVFPGYEKDWSLVQVALTDITVRKKAEAYLEFLGKHDVLTKLRNRTFYAEEMHRLDRDGPHPVSVLVIDMDGLKTANDQWGHAAGDELLRRTGEVLAGIVFESACTARTGGDEFAVLIPGMEEQETAQVVAHIQNLVAINNQIYTGSRLSLSIGSATSLSGEKLEETVKRADARMYEAKRRYYARVGHDRRGLLSVVAS